MKLRTFTAVDMPSAMKQIRDELGDDAIILATTQERGGKTIKVTAAIDRAEERTSFMDLKDTIDLAKRRTQSISWQSDLSECLEFHRTPQSVVSRILKTSESIDVEALLTLQKLAAETSKHVIDKRVFMQVLSRHFTFSPLPLKEAGRRFLFIGSEGAGKTLLTAKCATELVMAQHPVSVITTDHKRAGGIDQLAAFTDILKIPLNIAANDKEFEQILRSLPVNHTVLIDSPGFNAYDMAEKNALQKLASKPGIEAVFVLHAGQDAEESAYLARECAVFSPKRVIITHMDTTRRFGSLLAAADSSSLAISGYSSSQKVVDKLQAMDADALSGFILEYRLHKETNRRKTENA